MILKTKKRKYNLKGGMELIQMLSSAAEIATSVASPRSKNRTHKEKRSFWPFKKKKMYLHL
jgi:hypothetical protein